jgi:hypothetical protein
MSARRWFLADLTDEIGFGMADIAAAIGYPTAALRAYRAGTLQETDPDTAECIGWLVHDIGLLCSQLRRHGRPDPEVMLEAYLVEGYTVRGWDLYQRMDGQRCFGTDVPESRYEYPLLTYRHSALCSLAEGHPAAVVLDHYMSTWRADFWTDYEVVLAPDGYNSIVPKKRPQ